VITQDRLLAPAQAAPVWHLPGGRALRLRPVTPADAAAEQQLFSGMSLDSRHKRFHIGLRQLSPVLLRQLTEVDQRLHLAWVAETLDAQGLVADARYVMDPARPGQAEFALAVADDWQGLGLGRRLLAHLADHARRHGLRQLYGDVLPENRRMLALLRDLGAHTRPHPDGPQLARVVLELTG
jgi:acetyltransferase